MEWNKHPETEGRHAFLSPSGYTWLNYDKEKMIQTYKNHLRVAQGTYDHDLASRLIKTRRKLAPIKSAFNLFVNDCIGMIMDSEVQLKYSENCFGTADAIKFDEKLKELYVFDLKTGKSKADMRQLKIYSALFCLEYGRKPDKLKFICRIYQGNGFVEEVYDGSEIKEVMTQIKEMDKALVEAKSIYKLIM